MGEPDLSYFHNIEPVVVDTGLESTSFDKGFASGQGYHTTYLSSYICVFCHLYNSRQYVDIVLLLDPSHFICHWGGCLRRNISTPAVTRTFTTCCTFHTPRKSYICVWWGSTKYCRGCTPYQFKFLWIRLSRSSLSLPHRG